MCPLAMEKFKDARRQNFITVDSRYIAIRELPMNLPPSQSTKIIPSSQMRVWKFEKSSTPTAPIFGNITSVYCIKLRLTQYSPRARLLLPGNKNPI